jgi:hypothetical protein
MLRNDSTTVAAVPAPSASFGGAAAAAARGDGSAAPAAALPGMLAYLSGWGLQLGVKECTAHGVVLLRLLLMVF